MEIMNFDLLTVEICIQKSNYASVKKVNKSTLKLICLQVPTDSSCKSNYCSINYNHMKLLVLTLVHMKIIAFRHVTQCSLVDR